MIVTKRFYKENGMWFIDLPEFLEKGLGTKANLLMVAGADELLDILSQNGTEITLQFGDEIFIGSNVQLNFRGYGKDQAFLDYVGHAPVDNGAYYEAYNTEWLGFEFKISSLWLCPVTQYIFNGNYPKNIFIKHFII